MLSEIGRLCHTNSDTLARKEEMQKSPAVGNLFGPSNTCLDSCSWSSARQLQLLFGKLDGLAQNQSFLLQEPFYR